jgi:hypothetical protein
LRRIVGALAAFAAFATVAVGALAIAAAIIVPRIVDRRVPPALVAAAREPAPTPATREPAPAPAPPAPAPGPPAPAPPPTTFTVEIRSAPAGAQVVLAGKRVGVTPATLALDAPASLLVTHAGYRPQRIRAERAGAIDVRLVPAPPARRRPAAGETLD